MSFVVEFISTVQQIHATGSATEHSYRSALEALFTAPGDGVAALNEPRRIKCGAPDFLVSKGDIAIGHVEAKDLHIGLRAMKDANKAQQDRYRAALPNLIYTNCLDWDFYRDGGLVASVTIADLATDIRPRPDRYQTLENLLRDFIARRPQTIASPRELAMVRLGFHLELRRLLASTNIIKSMKWPCAGQQLEYSRPGERLPSHQGLQAAIHSQASDHQAPPKAPA